MNHWPERLADWLWMPDDDPWPLLHNNPQGIVVHSGAVGSAVGEYAVNEPDGRDIAYHFVWFESRQDFVQTVALNRRAGHAGKDGNHWLGIAFPGPTSQDPRPDDQRDKFLTLVHALVGLSVTLPVPLVYWCRHSDFSTHRDPGPGFKDEWMHETGLMWLLATARKGLELI